MLGPKVSSERVEKHTLNIKKKEERNGEEGTTERNATRTRRCPCEKVFT